jgi:hypothetical protein
MEEVKVSKCFTTAEMVELVSNLSSVDTALDIINECKDKLIVKLEIVDDKLRIKN